MISRKILQIQDGYGNMGYSYAMGTFFTMDNLQKCYTFPAKKCRVEFDWQFKSHIKYIGFNCLDLDIIKVNKVFREIEKKLKLTKRTKFYRTQYQNVMILELPKFWTNHHTNRSLITLLLRAVAVYYKTDFNQAITDYELAAKVKMAINHFLEGNTESTFLL